MTAENKSKTVWKIINNASGNIKNNSLAPLCTDQVKYLFKWILQLRLLRIIF